MRIESARDALNDAIKGGAKGAASGPTKASRRPMKSLSARIATHRRERRRCDEPELPQRARPIATQLNALILLVYEIARRAHRRRAG
ncbi:hypothetical protein B1812_17810 [Methylocystis bryophila]|uniref:Uncharacterized protein n=1 Tax=Methylocystis bryophila TaxID=655015 RepID=A0A1W6MYH9_9HYPH|nr:hypothetical protein B1812_17810 [Methylocystis bryophila]